MIKVCTMGNLRVLNTMVQSRSAETKVYLLLCTLYVGAELPEQGDKCFAWPELEAQGL